MADGEKRTNPKYETPIVVSLGELAKGIGACGGGSSPDDSCGSGATAPSSCGIGTFAGTTCGTGGAAS
jgi:hypothetical protein